MNSGAVDVIRTEYNIPRPLSPFLHLYNIIISGVRLISRRTKKIYCRIGIVIVIHSSILCYLETDTKISSSSSTIPVVSKYCRC